MLQISEVESKKINIRFDREKENWLPQLMKKPSGVDSARTTTPSPTVTFARTPTVTAKTAETARVYWRTVSGTTTTCPGPTTD